MDPILGNKVIAVSMRWHKQLLEMDHFWEPQNITLGKGDRNKYPLGFDFLPETLNLVEKKGDNLYISFLDEFSGELVFDRETIPLDQLKTQSQQSIGDTGEKIHQYRFETSTKARLGIEAVDFDIRYVPKPPPVAQFERTFDKFFLVFILFSFLLLVGIGAALSLMVKPPGTNPEEDLALLSERMVELIVNPPKPKKISKRLEEKAQQLTKKRTGEDTGIAKKGDDGAGGKGPKQKLVKNIARAKAGGPSTEAPPKPQSGVLSYLAGGGKGSPGLTKLLGKGANMGNIARSFGQGGGKGGGHGAGALMGYADGIVGGVLDGNTTDIAKVDGGGVPGKPWGDNLGLYMSGKRKKGKFEVKIEDELAEIVGGLSKEEIRRVVDKHLSEIRYCYEKQLQRFPNLSGKVTVNFMISHTGKVLWVKRDSSSSMNNPQVENCVINRVQQWMFPMAKNGGNTEVVYPFMLNRLGNF